MVNPNIKPSVALLKEVKLFAPFSDAELGQMLAAGNSAISEAHANIIIEGEMTWGLYVILEGVVGILKTNKLTGEAYDVGQLRQGSFFGEMSLVDENTRSATVKALTDCHLFYISKENFEQFLAQSSDRKLRFYESCVKNLVSRLRELDDNYVISQYQLWKTALKKEAA
ncbi:cyclic nucleotide-binding domain-containing protein [Bdellovibrionota bacterium FG-1]